MSWTAALKEWNNATNNGQWVMPRKGTEAYDAVRAIQAKLKEAPKPEPKAAVVEAVVEVADDASKKRRGKAPKAAPAKPAANRVMKIRVIRELVDEEDGGK